MDDHIDLPIFDSDLIDEEEKPPNINLSDSFDVSADFDSPKISLLQYPSSKWGELLKFSWRYQCNSYSHGSMNDLNNDRKDGRIFCDFTIITQSDHFPVHKCVVGISSEFFKKSMFTEMKEKYENSVTVHNIRPKIMKIILDYAYGDHITITTDNIDELLEASDYLQFSQLHSDCVKFISRTDVTDENYLKVLIFAREKKLYSLLETCQTYIKNNFLQLFLQKQFSTIPNDSIADFFNLLNHGNVSSKLLYHAIVKWIVFDEEGREKYFSQLFQLVNLDEIPASFTVSVISENKLVLKNLECLQKVMKVIKNFAKEAVSKEILVVEQQTKSINVINYNISTKQFYLESSCEFDITLSDVGIVCVNNHLFIIGGCVSFSCNSCKTVYCFSLKTGVWTTKCPMQQKRRRFGCAVIGNFIFVAGGKARKTEILNSVECYDIICDSWTSKAPMLHKRAGCCLIEHNNLLYVLGGEIDTHYHTCTLVEKFDGTIWTSLKSFHYSRSNFAAVSLNNKLYVIGGSEHLYYNSSIEEYDIEKQLWSEVSVSKDIAMPPLVSACALGEKIYMAADGNIENGNHKMSCVVEKVYDPDKISKDSDRNYAIEQRWFLNEYTPTRNEVKIISLY